MDVVTARERVVGETVSGDRRHECRTSVEPTIQDRRRFLYPQTRVELSSYFCGLQLRLRLSVLFRLTRMAAVMETELRLSKDVYNEYEQQ